LERQGKIEITRRLGREGKEVMRRRTESKGKKEISGKRARSDAGNEI